MKLPRRCVHESLTTVVGSLAMVLAVVGFTACAQTPRTATNFCRVLADRIADMTEAPIDNSGVGRLIDHYSRLVEVAPLEVEDDFTVLRDLFVAASEVNVSDPASVQAVADLAYQAERAAEDAGVYAGAVCGLDLSTGLTVRVPDLPAAVPESSATTLAP
jgi:hypothetical protein